MTATDGSDDASDSSVSNGFGGMGGDGGGNETMEITASMASTMSKAPTGEPPIRDPDDDDGPPIPHDVSGLRLLSRSPHPYHHRNSDLLHPADRIEAHAHATEINNTHDTPDTLHTAGAADTSHPAHAAGFQAVVGAIPSPSSALSLASFASGFGFFKDSSPASDSGTEADDEHFLKGLPAPRSKPHKGLRGMNEVLSGISTPLLPVPLHSFGSGGGGGNVGSAHESEQHRRSRSGRKRTGRLEQRDNGSGVDTDGGDSVAGSVYSFVGDDAQDKQLDRAATPGRDVNAHGEGRRPQGHTPISPQTLFQKLKRDAVAASAALDSRDKDRRQGRGSAERSRRRREIVRRSTELLLLVSLAALLFSNPDVRPLLLHWRYELQAVTAVIGGLLLLYPLRLILWVRHYETRGRGDNAEEQPPSTPLRQLIAIPASFDPAPLFYPLTIPVFVSFLLATPTLHAAPLLNLVLSICTLPRPLLPFSLSTELCSPVHWTLSIVPLTVAEALPSSFKGRGLHSTIQTPVAPLSPDLATLIYPLHQTLCWLLHDLTTTSLLPAELQLLSVALINLLFLATSPQAVILQALLWAGGVSILVLGGGVVRRGILLARIPRWRFRRDDPSAQKTDSLWWLLSPAAVVSRVWAELKSLRRARLELMYGPGPGGSDFRGNSFGDSDDSTDNGNHSPPRDGGVVDGAAWKTMPHKMPKMPKMHNAPKTVKRSATVVAARSTTAPLDATAEGANAGGRPRRHSTTQTVTHTPSGRRKRATSPTIRAFFSLTHEQAVRRKWLYAAFLYACIAFVILAGIRPYVAAFALHGRDPFGWALGYLFGDIDWFRLEVVKTNLEGWVCLPPRTVSSMSSAPCPSCAAGWVEHIRQAWLGAATTRLLLAAYWCIVIVFGLAVVFTLSPVYEVDTRRKVFHFMMVAMLLPATFVDPAYAALALSLVLAVFLLLDLVRASQLPPLSRPIATFLTPYVDGRDLRGPVVISHIFLLIGCAIPLWLSMASLPRMPTTPDTPGPSETFGIPTDGWNVPTRDVSMVSGIICVGLGDAAASLIGRRWGRRKWLWGGGKSLEGSAAFALAVFAGLMLASLWLRVGGWAATGEALAPVSVSAASVGTEATGASAASTKSLVHTLRAALPPSLQRVVSWIGCKAAQSVAPRAAVCASVASLTEAVLTGGNDNVVVPVILWTCVKSFGL
ncbi:hypothetical protein HMPREF1624_00523 [Sporothrix schenckii ATCC 58251]|uniref:dolichol kinase n=1 Tax=Sporothrix schenckii (strain ATCC 58251 / de Perez 2211183) TaxID=1391915 RepID=U7Q5B5_SPOS1|nr:hypothetical protein HMPREF1624_00523 [Sporothrix schenckii ATCC 58251]